MVAMKNRGGASVAHQNNEEVRRLSMTDEMQTEVETLRNALVRLAVFVGGDPCWCQCEGGKHSEVCRDIQKLKLWPRVVRGRPKPSDYLPWR